MKLERAVTNLNEVRMLRISDGDHCVNLLYQLLLLIVIKIHIPLG